MDGSRFDDLTRALATGASRRRLLKGFAGGLAVAASAFRSRGVDAACRPAGRRCTGNGSCCSGLCDPATFVCLCPPGAENCRGDCLDPATAYLDNVEHCGGCELHCPLVLNGSPTCIDAVCGFVCNAGFILCGGACVPGGGCCIGDVVVPAGTLNPANQCQACQPAVDPTAYTNLAPGAGCDDGDACTLNDACNGAGACVGNQLACDTPPVCRTGPGTCNPADGSCTYPPAPVNTPCGAGPSCTAGVQHAQDTCNASGNCVLGTDTPCTPYVCGATACLTTCDGEEDCVDAAFCDPYTDTCEVGCGTGQHECPGGGCFDDDDPTHCGATCVNCPAGPANSTPTCVAGSCGFACNAEYILIGGVCCAAAQACNSVCCTFPDTCGGSGIPGVCGSGTCTAGVDVCSGTLGFGCNNNEFCICTTTVTGAALCAGVLGAQCAQCETDVDCLEVSGHGSACIEASGICCGGAPGTRACVPPCTAPPETCPTGANYCEDLVVTGCGGSIFCACLQTTTDATFCGNVFDFEGEPDLVCAACSTGSECEAITGPGSACFVCDQCGGTGGTGCVAPCGSTSVGGACPAAADSCADPTRTSCNGTISCHCFQTPGGTSFCGYDGIFGEGELVCSPCTQNSQCEAMLGAGSACIECAECGSTGDRACVIPCPNQPPV